MNCEICGMLIRGDPQLVITDSAKLWVCNVHAKLGTPIKETVAKARTVGSSPAARPPLIPKFDIIEEELQLKEDFGTVIKEARERMGLTQEQLALKINERASLIRHLETGKMKPTDTLAGKLERFLKVDLYGASEEDFGV